MSESYPDWDLSREYSFSESNELKDDFKKLEKCLERVSKLLDEPIIFEKVVEAGVAKNEIDVLSFNLLFYTTCFWRSDTSNDNAKEVMGRSVQLLNQVESVYCPFFSF